MIKYINFIFKDVHPNIVKDDSVSMHDVPQRDDAGFGELYQQIKVEFDNNYNIISVEKIGESL